MDIITSLIAWVNGNQAVAGGLGVWLVNELIRFSPVKANSILEVAGNVMVVVGSYIQERAKKLDGKEVIKP